MSSNRPSLTRSIEALQHRDFRLLFLSSVVSSIGGQLQIIANTWQLFELTGSAVQIGIIGLARAVPIILFSLAGGVVADRVDRRKIIMTTQLLNGSFALFLAIVTLTHATQPWHVYLVTFLNASLMSVSGPGRRAIIAGLVPRHHLMNALGLNQTLQQTSRVLAPSIAGVLIAAFGLAICYFITAIATLITAAWLTFIHVAPLPERPKASPLADLSEGLAFARRQPVILGLLGADMASQLFGSFQVLLPIFADSYGVGAAGYGVLASAPAVGALAGAAVVMSLGDVRYKGYWIIGSILAYCVGLVALALTPWFAMAWIVVAILGFTDAMQSVPRNALIQLVTPDELRGRVSAFQGMIVNSGPGLGLGLMGAAAGAIGAPFALIGGAILCAAANVGILITRPELRARDLTDEAEAASSRAMVSS
jgi:MFS family permease